MQQDVAGQFAQISPRRLGQNSIGQISIFQFFLVNCPWADYPWANSPASATNGRLYFPRVGSNTEKRGTIFPTVRSLNALPENVFNLYDRQFRRIFKELCLSAYGFNMFQIVNSSLFIIFQRFNIKCILKVSDAYLFAVLQVHKYFQ